MGGALRSDGFVRDSIRAVVQTLLEAVVLVVLVVILFLQTWRASIIPLIAVPVSVVGTFSILYLLGFSLNTLSLFGLVLAIGIVVDDAIVVVENVERNIEEGLLRLRRRIRRCVKCPGRLSPLRWCCARCLCRWRFSPALPVSSTNSLR
jgi:multidrug efflux pump